MLTMNTQITREHAGMYESAQIIEAIGIAQEYIEEAERLLFDLYTDADSPSDFTAANSLGPRPGEYYPHFNDLDDFNKFRTTRVINSVQYNVLIRVHYVSTTAPYDSIGYRSYMKQMVVRVASPSFRHLPSNTLILKRIFAYNKLILN